MSGRAPHNRFGGNSSSSSEQKQNNNHHNNNNDDDDDDVDSGSNKHEIVSILASRPMKKRPYFYVLYDGLPFSKGEWLPEENIPTDVLSSFIFETRSGSVAAIAEYFDNAPDQNAAIFHKRAAPEKFCSLCNNACKGLYLKCHMSNSHSLCGECARNEDNGYRYTTEDLRRLQKTKWTCNGCTVCIYCKKSTPEETMLICDSCNCGVHLECMTPPLRSPPKGDFFCPDCQKKKQGSKSSKAQKTSSASVPSSSRRPQTARKATTASAKRKPTNGTGEPPSKTKKTQQQGTAAPAKKGNSSTPNASTSTTTSTSTSTSTNRANSGGTTSHTRRQESSTTKSTTSTTTEKPTTSSTTTATTTSAHQDHDSSSSSSSAQQQHDSDRLAQRILQYVCKNLNNPNKLVKYSERINTLTNDPSMPSSGVYRLYYILTEKSEKEMPNSWRSAVPED